jgi:NAD+ synthase (glutamine-hydrolysing)
MQIAIAQLNQVLGDLAGNSAAILAAIGEAERAGARFVVTPELSLCGYPPEDLVLRPAFLDACERELKALAGAVGRTPVAVGFPEIDRGVRYNALAVLAEGRVQTVYRKQMLPNYRVFDEERYFEPGNAPCVVDIDGIRVGFIICEDVWFAAPARQAKEAGARVIVVPNGSPYHTRQQEARREQLGARVRETGLPFVYANRVGGQDELVFDGASFVMNAHGEVVQQMPAWHETIALATLDEGGAPRPVRGTLDPRLEYHVYEALVMGVRDYVTKNRFPGVLLGLSGGVDSALVLAVAVDALGRDRVHAVMMPSPYTRSISLDDAREMADILRVRYSEIGIEPMFAAFRSALAGEFKGLAPDAAEENIQARVRGTLLMALSNKFGSIVLTTGNKSEMAVGYATLYGDMAGGFGVLKDISKTLVYRLCAYRNALGRVIPERIITRAPSAELRPDQVDQDSLPPYDALDGILEAYVEQDRSPGDIVALGFEPEHVRRVVRLIKMSEYKRRQAAVGIRVTPRGFGRDWRYPITSAWHEWEDPALDPGS